MIVTQALESSKSNTTIVVADDTDILVLLCSNANDRSHPIFLQPSHRIKTKNGNQSAKIANTTHSKSTWESFNYSAGNSCLFRLRYHIQAVWTWNKGVLRKFIKSKELQEIAAKFLSDHDQEQEVVTYIGEQILSVLYGGSSQGSLDTMIFTMFASKVATPASVVPYKF